MLKFFVIGIFDLHYKQKLSLESLPRQIINISYIQRYRHGKKSWEKE